jgi:hypothetical protein
MAMPIIPAINKILVHLDGILLGCVLVIGMKFLNCF